MTPFNPSLMIILAQLLQGLVGDIDSSLGDGDAMKRRLPDGVLPGVEALLAVVVFDDAADLLTAM